MNKRGSTLWGPQGQTLSNQQPGGDSAESKPKTPTHVWAVIILLVLAGIMDFFFSDSTYVVLIVTAFFAIFGIIHFFSTQTSQKLGLGLLPLILAVTSLPGVIGGASFLGMLASVPILNFLVPPSITRLIIVLVIIIFYKIIVPTKEQYGAQIDRASGSALGSVQWKMGIKNIVWWVLIVALIYGFEVSGGIMDMLGVGAMYGGVIVGLALIVFGLIMFSRKKALDSALGVVSIILALFSVSSLVGLDGYFDWIPGIADLLPGYPIRYLFIAVLVADLVFREKVKTQ